MATETFANFPSTTVSSGGTDAPSGGTSQSWTVASSASFPAAATGTSQFHIADPAANTEIILVTNVSGTTWTVTRGAESTTPVAHTAGFTVQQVVTAGALGTFLQGPLDATAADIKPVSTAAVAGASGKAPDASHVHLGFFGGIFGTGADGPVTLDAVTTYNGFSSLAGSAYSLTRDVMATSLTVNSGVILRTASFRVFCQGTLSNSGTISNAGNAAVGSTAGTATGSASFGGGQAGGAGGAGVSGAGTAGVAANFGVAGGAGGTGNAGAAGGGGVVTVSNTNAQSNLLQTPVPVLAGVTAYNATNLSLKWGAGGGGGGSDSSSNAGGGGGSGGGIVAVTAWGVNNASGTITVAGGAGGNGAAGNAGGGGGGSGGLIVAYTLSAWSAGTLTVGGGAAGNKAGTGANGTAGGTGLALNVVLA